MEGVTLTTDTNIPDLIDNLTYINYAYNRERSPDIKPSQWAKIYPNADKLELRFQVELALRGVVNP